LYGLLASCGEFGGSKVRPSLESYAHKAAKAVVAGWLRDAARSAGDDMYVDNLLGFNGWRVNRPAPTWGVWEEYPVLSNGHGICPVWDESGYGDERPPTVSELAAEGRFPTAVFDIAVQHKGVVIWAIEIEHKNPLSSQKVRRLIPHNLNLLALPSQWVLGQVGLPSAVPEAFWVWRHLA
jgi:hypothetical protein